MRHFWLKKEEKIWDLTTKNDDISSGSFFGGPEGLGVKLKIESYEIERAFFIESVKMESMEIGGKLYFLDYEHFSKFIEFIGYLETTEPMRLYYSMSDAIDYYSDDEWYKLVLIKELPKTEIEYNTGCLTCSVKFAAVSRWKKDKVVTLELEPFGTPLVYPYVYPYFYGGQNNVGVHIDNTGNLPTHCTVKIEAETDTPVFRLMKDGKVLDQARYGVYIRSGSFMLINSDPANQEASLYTELSSGEMHREDVYYLGERDYTYSNFITIPSGRSLFLFAAENSQFGKVTLNYSLQRELI